MATPAEVIRLLADLRSGGTFARAKGAAEAFRAFSSLSSDQKRDLAVLVAERAAPHLVPRIEAETGLDLSREQVQAVLDMAGRLDAEDLDELAHTVRDREARGAAIEEVVGAAAAATGLDDVVADDHDDDGAETAQPPEAPQAEETAETAEAEALEPEVSVEPLELDPAPEPSLVVEPAPEPEAFVSVFDTLPDVPDWSPPPRSEPEPSTSSTSTSGTGTATVAREDLTARVRADRQPLVEQLRGARSNADRLRVLRGHAHALADLDRPTRRAVVAAVPDGWARRRTLEVLLDAQALASAEVPELVRMLGSPMARAWVCGSAIEADMLRVDDVEGIVDARAAARLRRRYG